MQLLKWLFAVLVVLNLIVFANVVTQKMNGNRPKQNPAVVAVPIGGGTDASGNPIPAQNAGTTSGSRVVAPAITRRPAAVAGGGGGNTTLETAALPKNAPSCSAQITLPEDAYHRLKNFIGGWNHAASRNVVENKQKGKASGVQYQVLVAGSSDEALQQLRSAGISASPQGGSISLGVYPDAGKANSVRDRAIAAGVGGVIVSERGSAQSALTSAQYTVSFRNITNQDAQKINEVLGRYGRLQRSACSQ